MGRISSPKSGRHFWVSTFSRNEVVAETIRVILEQIGEFQTVQPTDAEFDDTRSYFVGSFASRQETPQDVAGHVWLVESQELGRDYFKKLFRAIDKTTKQDCVRLAKNTIDPETLAIIVIGDAEKLKDTLAEIAPVQVIEPDKQ